MDDETEARALIAEIRRNKGVDEPGGLSELATDLENSIRTLSEDLYSTPTRFLLELIQNADDNRYDDAAVPQVSIVYRNDGFLWVGCNELGFAEANVKAICRIRHSTKKVEGGRKGYIGEKGIGFKSVFKVADLVWVKSGALQFQFDKEQPLGMIAPRWCSFNHNHALAERTMFCFRIPDMDDRDVVAKELTSLEPELLLFLRQIRKINITVQGEDGLTETTHHLKRRDDVVSGLKMTELLRTSGDDGEDDAKERFVICQHTAKAMPFEAKRPGVAESDILVAFPVDDALNPQIQGRRVYNFLPIRGYGFPFVLQADFVLSANREAILRHNAWNKTLIAATADLIVESVQQFNNVQRLQYTWLKYLTFQGEPHDTAFAGFSDHLIRTLRNSPVLESQSSTLARPLDLLYVPPRLTDGHKPLLTGPYGLESFAHHAYSSEDLAALSVRQQSPDDFLELLHDYVGKRPTEFRQQPPVWHSRLASAIMAIGPEHVRALKLIPVRGGQWMAVKGNKLFFPDIEEGTALPGGIEVEVVDDAAGRDTARRRLFTALGVCTLDEAKVFEIILQQHARRPPGESSWSVEDVVEHAWFLFRASATPSGCNTKHLLVASTDGRLRHGEQTYMDVPGSDLPASKLLGNARTTVPFLHERYLDKPRQHPTQDPAGPGNLTKKWLAWLEKAAGVRVLPRLAASGKVSAEFEMIIRSSRANDWLLLLKNEPGVYSGDLQAPENGDLRVYLANSPVLCVDGMQRSLKSVYLPTTEILAESFAKGSVPFLEVNDPNDPRWSSLDTLHLRRGLDGPLFVSILLRMQENKCPFTFEDVKRMYSGLARKFCPWVRQQFETKPLVYIPSTQPAKWVKLEACRWDAPAAIITLFALNQRYKSNAQLFLHRMCLANASAADVVRELAKLSGRSESIDTIRELLKVLTTYLVDGKLDENSLTGLTKTHVKILPVKIGQHEELCSLVGNNYFVEDEDQPLLCESFQGLVRFVDCDYLTKRKPRTLLEKFGCLANLLSERYFTEHDAKGEVTYEAATTKALRAKAEYLSRLVEESQRQESKYRLSALEVRSADDIVIRRLVKINDKPVYGRDEAGTITLKGEGSVVVIYYSRKRTSRKHLPFYQITDQFVEMLNIQKRHKNLAMTILMGDDNLFIENELERAGCGRPKSTNDAASGIGAAPKILDLTAAAKKKPALNTSSDHTLTIGSAVRFGPTARTPVPECHANPHTARSGSMEAPQLNGFHSVSPPSTVLPNGFSRPGFSSRHATDRPRAPQTARSGSTSAYDGTGNRVDTRRLDLSLMRTQLDEAMALENDRGLSSQPQQTAIFDGTTATEAELAIGRAGETFVYEMLKKELGISDDCWTSNSRSSYQDLKPFDGDEADYADFTISDPTISAKMTDWLIHKIDVAAAGRWLDTTVTYHVEVKTTSSHCGEVFDLSNNQARLSKYWHTSPRDVMLIVRVFQVLSGSPSFHVYLDPQELKKNGVLLFEPKGGWYIMPAPVVDE